MPQLEQSMAVQQQTKKLKETLEFLQSIIDLQTNKLRDFRKEKEKESRSELISSEISALEGKLMRHFANQILAKIKYSPGTPQESTVHLVRQYPRLKDFLYAVNIEEEMVKEIESRCSSVEELFRFSDEKLRGIFYNHDDNEVTTRRLNAQYQRLSMARNILQTFVVRLQNGEKSTDLQWVSWSETLSDSLSPSVRSSIASYLSVFSYSGGDEILKSRSIPPSPSPARVTTIPRSKSDEANIGQRIKPESTSSAGSTSSSSRHRVKSESRTKHGLCDLTITKPSTDGETDSENSKSRSSSMSQSPRTPTAGKGFWISHSIKHRFSAKQLLVSVACGYCNRVMLFGLKCKECGFKCHKKCSKKAPPSCSLPEDLLKVFQDSVDSGQNIAEGLVTMKRTNSEPSAFANRVGGDKHMPKNRSHGSLPHQIIRDPGSITVVGDSSSMTSSTSSMSSSPFHSDSPLGTPSLVNTIDTKEGQFPFFPDENKDFLNLNGGIDLDELTSTQSTVNSEASTDTLIDTDYSKSSSDTKSSQTLSIQGEDESTMDELELQISDVRPYQVRLRGKHSLTKSEKIERLLSLHNHGSLMSEWVIPYQDIEQGELIGQGRVGKVYKAKWHGEVALKVLYLENPTMEEKNDFKYKVQVLRRTRHENLILFMGACMEPPTLAIVTSLCKGNTLYQHIHMHRTRFDDTKLVSIVQQIAQAMSYLHARKIVHRDLKSKNIFLENNRIVITDFGLISTADVKVTNERPNYLLLPQGWLGYQAPEIVRKLNTHDPGCEVKLYTEKTDVYAFGGVWFELLAGMWPFAHYPVEAIIWQIGKGVKQSLSKLEITREAKDILLLVWAHNPENRPAFSMLLKAFERLPRKKLVRSPSQPTYLTRSAEALLL